MVGRVKESVSQSQAVAGRAGAGSPAEAGVLLTATSPARPQGAVRAGLT